MSDPVVGVLLPLGLETRFLAPREDPSHPGTTSADEPDEWRIRIRVIPDEVATDRHDPFVTESERLGLEAMWAAVSVLPDPENPGQSARLASGDIGWPDAFGRLAAQVGEGRAGWLVRTIPVRRPEGGVPIAVPPPADDTRHGAPVLRGLPSRLDVWIVWKSDPSGTAEVAAQLFPKPELANPLIVPHAADLALWENATAWEFAVEVGLGPRTPDDISVLGVSGLGPGDGTTPRQLLQAHADAGRLAVVPPGEPTSTIRGGPTIASHGSGTDWLIGESTDPSGTLDALIRPPRSPEPPEPPDPPPVSPVHSEGVQNDHELDDKLLTGLCFPALFGYGFVGPLGAISIGDVGPLWEWSSRWLRPEGNYASVRVGDQVYGVLPIANPDRLAGAGLTELAGVEPLLPLLGRLLPRFAEAAEADGGLVGRPGHPAGVSDAVRTVRRGPVPGGIGWFRGRDWVLDAAIAAMEGGDGEEAVVDAMKEWDTENQKTREVLDGTSRPRRRYRARGGVGRLQIPELGPGLDDPNGPPAVAEALMSTIERLRGMLQSTWFGREGDDRPVVLSLDERDVDLPESLLVRLYLRSLAVASSQLAVLAATRLQNYPVPDPGVPMSVIDPPIGGRLQLDKQVDKLIDEQGLLSLVEVTDPLASQLIWLAEEALDRLLQRLHVAGREPSARRPLLRALRALIEASANRWDVWLTAVGAATVHAAYTPDTPESEPTAVLGAYGWVDNPFRGTPGPGPGGFLLAPSQDHAATAAVLRDASIRDSDPERWALLLDSGTVGPAQRMLSALAVGWHPAEWTGRMIERRFADSSDVNGEAQTDGLAWLRGEYPLRAGQGAHGCCHGLRILAEVKEIEPGPLWRDATEEHRTALLDAISWVGSVRDTAAELELAEGVHDFLAGHPVRAGTATKVLAGELVPGRLDVLDPSRPGRSVRTVVFAALPAIEDAATPPGGMAAVAAPGFDAMVANRFAEPSDWEFTLRLEGGSATLSLADLGLRPADCVTQSDMSLSALAMLVLATRGDTRPVGKVTVPAAVTASRELARLLRGRVGDPDDLAPTPAADPTEAEDARASAFDALHQRVSQGTARADALAGSLTEAVTAARGEPPAVADIDQLAQLLIEAAGWGTSIPTEAADLFAEDEDRRARALGVVLATLDRTAAHLRARIDEARVRLDSSDIAQGIQVPDGASTSLGSVTAALTRLVGDAAVPIGAVLPRSLLAASLEPTTDTRTQRDWLRDIAKVRPRVAELASGLKGRNPVLAGLTLYASKPDDPWRVDALAEAVDSTVVMPPPRFEVVLSPGEPGDEAEWIVLETLGETVPDADSALGFAFDAATPGAAPPSALLLVPQLDPAVELTAADLPAAVLQARAMARARMVDPSSLAKAGLGPLSAFAALPQYALGGLPVTLEGTMSLYEDVAFLQPLPTQTDTEDVIAGVTADPLWMLGIQWRLGEHLGEDAASPARVDSELTVTRLPRGVAQKPFEATVESETTWDRSELAYTATVTARDSTLTVQRHPGGPVDWWAMTADSVPDGTSQKAKSVPRRVNWPGAPRRRYWQIEDQARDPAGKGPDAAHPATLHLIRLLARHGDDWYVAPLAAPLGTAVRPTEVTLIDAAGGHWTLRTPPEWSLFAVQGLDPPAGDPNWHRALPVLASAAAALHGPASDEIAFAVDEDANLVWGAILRTDGEEPPPSELPPTPLRSNVPDDGPVEVDWQLAGRVPVNRIAYLYGGTIDGDAYGNGEDRFVQAAFLDPRLGTPLPVPTSPIIAPPTPGDPPHTIEPLALPSSGVRIVEQPMLARDVNGRPVRWRRRTIVPLDTTVDVPLHWDLLTQRTD